MGTPSSDATRHVLATRPQSGQGNPVQRGMLAVRQGDRLVPSAKPDAETADAYLRMAAHILLKHQRSGCRTFGVISSRDGEGKTTAAVNLAVCLGRTRGRAGRVLLVDGDIRQRGMSTLLGGSSATTGKHPMLVGTAFEGVDLMTAPEATDALTLYDPAAWARTLHDLSQRYAQILVDIPAVLDHPEGLVLRECVEELILVVRGESTLRTDVESALGSVGRRVLGVILSGRLAGS